MEYLLLYPAVGFIWGCVDYFVDRVRTNVYGERLTPLGIAFTLAVFTVLWPFLLIGALLDE